MTFQIVSMLLCVVLAANYYFANVFNAQKVAVFATRALATLSVLCVMLLAMFIRDFSVFGPCFGIISVAMAFALVGDMLSQFNETETKNSDQNFKTIVCFFRIIAVLFCIYGFILLNLEIGHTLLFVLVSLGLAMLAFNVHVFSYSKLKKISKISYDVIANSLMFACLVGGFVYFFQASLFVVKNLYLMFSFALLIASSLCKDCGVKRFAVSKLLYHAALLLLVAYFVF